MANSRARTVEDTEGLVKFVSDAKTDKILGAHIMGPNAGGWAAKPAALRYAHAVVSGLFHLGVWMVCRARCVGATGVAVALVWRAACVRGSVLALLALVLPERSLLGTLPHPSPTHPP